MKSKIYNLIKYNKFFYYLRNSYLSFLILYYYFVKWRVYFLEKLKLWYKFNTDDKVVNIIFEWRSWDLIVMLDFVINIIYFYKRIWYKIKIIWNSKFKEVIEFLFLPYREKVDETLYDANLEFNFLNCKYLSDFTWVVLNPFVIFIYKYWKFNTNNFYIDIYNELQKFYKKITNSYYNQHYSKFYKIIPNKKKILCNFESYSANIVVKQLSLQEICPILEKIGSNYWITFYVNKVYNKEEILKDFKFVKIVSYSFKDILHKVTWWEFDAFISYRNWLNDIFWKITDISQLIFYNDSYFPYYIDDKLFPFNYLIKYLNYNKTMKSFYSIKSFCKWYLKEKILHKETFQKDIENFILNLYK